MNKIIDRNYKLLFLDKIFFINAMAFLSINTVITYFLNELGANTFVISLATILASLGILMTQPIFAKLAMKLPLKIKIFFKILLVQRLLFLIFVLFIPFIAAKSDTIMVVMFLIFWTTFNLFVGSYGPFFMSIMPKLISREQRGRMAGYGLATGSLIAIGSAILIGKLLSQVIYPYNYTLIFGIGIFILFIDALLFHFMETETPDPITNQNFGYLQYFKYVPQVLRTNKKFTTIVMGSCFFVISNISLTYYGLFAIKTYHAGAKEIAIFTGITMAINVLANLILGILGDKKGHGLVLQLSALSGVVAGIIVLTTHSLFAVYVAFALSAFSMCGYQLSSGMLIIESVPKEELPLYISVNTIISLILSSIVMLISSVIIDQVSFKPVFILTFLCGIGAYFVFKRFHSNTVSTRIRKGSSL